MTKVFAINSSPNLEVRDQSLIHDYSEMNVTNTSVRLETNRPETNYQEP